MTQELVPNERIVSTDGGTLLMVLVQHSSKEHRDGHVNSGMEVGLQESLDVLERVVRSLG